MELSRQNRDVWFSGGVNTQSSIVNKPPLTRIRPICLDSGGTLLVRGGLFSRRERE
jgi:hypothetical protein